MNNIFQIGNTTGSVGRLTGSINFPYLTEQQLIAGESGYISPAIDMASIEIKRKALLEQQKLQKENIQKNTLIGSIMAIPQNAIKPFDITQMDKIRQTISSKTLGAQQLRIPVMGA